MESQLADVRSVDDQEGERLHDELTQRLAVEDAERQTGRLNCGMVVKADLCCFYAFQLSF